MGFRWTLFFDWKGQFFPSLYSWCGAFSPNMHALTNKLKLACIWTGWGLRKTQEVILNTQCTNHSHQGEEDPRRRVPWCSLPKPRVEVTPRSKSDPRPLFCCVLGKKGAPDDNHLCFYTMCEAHDDVHWWCKDSIIKCYTSSWPSSTGTIGGKWVAGSWVHS